MARQRVHFIGNIYKTNRDGDAELLSLNKKIATIRFLNTGFEREVNIDNLVAGKAKDYSVENRKLCEKEFPNTRMSSNNYGDFIVLEKYSRECVVQFIETGYTTKALWENVKIGKIADPYFKSAYGVGYLGEYKRPSYWKQAQQLWRNMLKRCYSPNDGKGYYGKGVSVDDRWLCFANFLEDLPLLENFDLWLAGQHGNSTKYNLDKDFKIKDNKVYSREACMFLTEYMNKSYTSRTNKWAGIENPV